MSDDGDDAPFDEDNPEWTAEDFARARPISDFPELAAAFADAKSGHKPIRAVAATKSSVSLRIDRDVLERFRAGGAGWQTRMNAALRKAAGLGG